MTTLIARFARLGYTLTPCPDGYELAIEPPAVFSSAGAALAWLERREAEQARRVGDVRQMELWERAA